MTTLHDIEREIIGGNFTNDDLRKIENAIKFRRADLTRQTVRTMSIGVQVKYTSHRTGRPVTGTVQKIGRKFVVVNVNGGLWRVPANMLTDA